VTLKKALNDHEIGRTIEFALQQPCVRGVTFQPVQHAGRADGYDPAHDRLTLTEVRRRILEQSSVFRPEDVIPVPCHPDSLAMDENIFRIIITQFIDAHAFDVRSVK
jgi:7,8-dihydro-6-hydroxymethylpterin dimethyltransferase